MTLHDKLDPTHTALIVVDIQNDFCAPSGLMAGMGKDVSKMDELVERIEKLAAICEEVNIPVFYTQQIYDRQHLTDLQKEQYDLDGKMVTCDVEGDGWKFYKLDPPVESVYPKFTYNIFSNEKLTNQLKNSGIKTLIISGVSTQICVETAIRNGFDLGYKIVVPADMVATTSKDPETQQRTLNLVQKTYGVVSSFEEVSNLLESKV
jgi:ureidoacrylate peracid hydrolase